MIGGQSLDFTCESSVEYFDPNTNHWYNFPNMKNERIGSDAVCVNNAIWVFGGMNKNAIKHLDTVLYDEILNTNRYFKKLNSYEICDPRIGKWITPANKMKFPRFALSTVYDNDYGIWIIGGKISDIRTNYVEFFDIRNQKFLNLTKNFSQINTKKGGVMSCCFGETIYVFGGKTQREALSSIETLDLYKGYWKSSKEWNINIGVFGAGIVKL